VSHEDKHMIVVFCSFCHQDEGSMCPKRWYHAASFYIQDEPDVEYKFLKPVDDKGFENYSKI
jgi:hypothetical protein